MSRFIGFVSGLVLVLASASRAADAPETPAVLGYLSQQAVRLTEALPALPETREAWEKQRGELIPKLTAALGLPERGPMRA